MLPNADRPDHDDLVARLLCEALDGATTDPTRLALLTRLCLMNADADRDADLARLRQSCPLTVTTL